MGENMTPPLRSSRRFQFAASRSLSSSASRSFMDVPRLSLDALSLARALLHAVSDSLVQLRARPRVETAVKSSGGVVAALLALKYAKSLRSACMVGLLAGVFAHSLYADVLRKNPAIVTVDETTKHAVVVARRRNLGIRDAHVDEEDEKEHDERISKLESRVKRAEGARDVI